MRLPDELTKLPGVSPSDGSPVAVMDSPELNSPVARLTLSIDEGRLLIRINESMRRLVLATARGCSTA
jgi:hypothetical protein